MLSQIREKTQGIIATFILALVTIPFALWGINSYFDTGTDPYVAKANGIEITQNDYRRTLDRVRAADPRRDPRALREFVLEQMIDQALVLEDADAKGYRVSNARLSELIRELPYFQRDGRFDPQLYEARLRQEGMTPAEFEARLRREQTAAQLQYGLIESAFVSEPEVVALARLRQQEHRIGYVIVNPGRFLAATDIDARAVDEYYAAHADEFRTPEEVRIEYVRLSMTDITRGYQPREDELRAAYDEDPKRYVTPERRRASHILIEAAPGAEADAKALAQAQELERQLRAGADFAALARKYSNDPASAGKSGDLGEIGRGLLPPELEAAVYALKNPGEISAPVHTRFGYHLVKVTGLKPEVRRSFESARAELVETARKRRGEERFYELAERLRELAYDHPDSLAPVAKELGLTIENSGWFTRAGGSGIAAHRQVVEAAFGTEVLTQGRNSEVVEIDATTLAVVRLGGHRPAVAQPLAAVRAGIERRLKEQGARERALKHIDALNSELEGGAGLPELARREGLKYETPGPISRNNAQGVDPRIAEAAFRAPRPRAGGRPSVARADLGAQGYALVAVLAVEDRDPGTADTASKEQTRQLLLERRGGDYYAQYRRGLRRDADVSIRADVP